MAATINSTMIFDDIIKLFSKKKENIKKTIHDPTPPPYQKLVSDISDWKDAVAAALNIYNPETRRLQEVFFNDIIEDPLVFSQVQNRKLGALKREWGLYKDEKKDEELTKRLKALGGEVNEGLLDTEYFGHTLIQFYYKKEMELAASVLPRTNVIPLSGEVIESFETQKRIKYRELKEFGTWIVEAGGVRDLGLFNKIVPYVLFKKFAMSSWSEHCEINGIPPRWMRVNKNSRADVISAQKMMETQARAGWAIIGENEEINFAAAVANNGDLYEGFIKACKSEISMSISGAIIGQDTATGSYSKDKNSSDNLSNMVDADIKKVESYWQTDIIPALEKIGVIGEGYTMKFDPSDSTSILWERTLAAMPYYDVPLEWVKNKFGVELEKKSPVKTNLFN